MSMADYHQWCQDRLESRRDSSRLQPPKIGTASIPIAPGGQPDESLEEQKDPYSSFREQLSNLEGEILLDKQPDQTNEQANPPPREPAQHQRRASNAISEQSHESDSWNQESVRGANSPGSQSPREPQAQVRLNLQGHLRPGNMRLLREKAVSNQVVDKPSLSARKEAPRREQLRQSARIRSQQEDLLPQRPPLDSTSSTKDQPEDELKVQWQNRINQNQEQEALAADKAEGDASQEEAEWMDIEEQPGLQINLQGSQCLNEEIPNKLPPSRQVKDSSRSLGAAAAPEPRRYIFQE